MPDFKELIDCIRREDVTVFLGSGFSLKAGAPSGKAIANAIANAVIDLINLFIYLCSSPRTVIFRPF